MKQIINEIRRKSGCIVYLRVIIKKMLHLKREKIVFFRRIEGSGVTVLTLNFEVNQKAIERDHFTFIIKRK